jgi:hypothetical protein
MDQTDDAPFFFIFSPLSRTIAHDPFHCKGVFDKAVILIVFCKKSISFFSCNYSGSMVHGSGFKVKEMKEGLYSLDKYPVHPIF